MTQPNFFVIGAPKCGTSALTAYLDQHPEVFICKPKEPFYWSSDYVGAAKKLSGIETLSDYLNLFENATGEHRVVGEGSTNYLRSECAVKDILQFKPQAKFVVMLRNPVDVAHAYHSEQLFAHWEDDADFESAWRKQASRKKGRNIPSGCPAPQFLYYGDIATYTPQLKNFFEIVPESQRKVIIFDDFAADTKSVFDETVAFAGLSPFEKNEFERVNAAHGHRYPMLSKLMLDPPAPIRPAVEALRSFCRKFQGGMITKAKHMLRKPQKRKPMSDEFRSELCEYFANDVVELSEMLDRDLTHWTGIQRNQNSCDQNQNTQCGQQRAEAAVAAH